jgi:hypothetical protein
LSEYQDPACEACLTRCGTIHDEEVPFEDEEPENPFSIERFCGLLLELEDLKRFRDGDRRFVWPKEITVEPNKQLLTQVPKYAAFEAVLCGLPAVELKTFDQIFVSEWSIYTRFSVGTG